MIPDMVELVRLRDEGEALRQSSTLSNRAYAFALQKHERAIGIALKHSLPEILDALDAITATLGDQA
jgi:hypothetical protein